jgi:hypothetical protein
MATPIKLTMLGGTQTGKTCYLVGMYGMMRKGTNGFTFAAVDLDEDLVLAQQWKTMRTTTGEKRWPPATIETKDHEFDFCYGYKSFRRFVWHDYRGSALHSPLTDPDAQRLAERLAESSCVLFCFSAAHLTDPDGQVAETMAKALEEVKEGEDESARMRRVAKAGAKAIEITEDGEDESTRMNRLMSEVARKGREKGRPLPAVVVVLTKYDLIAGWPQPQEDLLEKARLAGWPRAAVLEKVRQLFSPLYAPGSGWTVTTCPVSLGKDLVGDRDKGKVEAINLHRPVAFAVYCSIRQAAAQAKADRAARASALGEAQNMGWLGRWWRGVDLTDRTDAVDRSQAEVEELGRQLDLLFRELVEGLMIYHNGQESEFHD